MAALAQIQIAARPLCEACMQLGRITPANEVDHRTPISVKGRKERRAEEAFPHTDDLASLCKPCHSAKTRAEQRGEKNWLFKGCDVFGRPLDPRHHWNLERQTK
jgi:5-methylcytosine-specific restriction enzyme A